MGMKTQEDYDPLDDFTLEELEEMGVIEIPKVTKVIDGDTGFITAVRNGEDW